MPDYDFCGWATKNNIRCSDGRTIMRDAFIENDGQKVPLVYNHQHNDPRDVLGHALLENRPEGVYAYCKFNNTEDGQTAKELVRHGDITSLSIYANQLKHSGSNVVHGLIREVSLVLAGANPGASIQDIVVHGETLDDEVMIYTGEQFELNHSEESSKEEMNKGDGNMAEKTVKDVIDSMTEEQRNVMYALIGQALDDQNGGGNTDEDDEEEPMKHNAFDNSDDYVGDYEDDGFIAHSDQVAILSMAKQSNIGTLKHAIDIFESENGYSEGAFSDQLQHGFDDITQLFPDFHDVMPGAPEKIPENNGWVDVVMSKVHKSPYQRIRTRQADVSKIKASGYQDKGTKKKDMGLITMVMRTTDPQTVYIKDTINRDDVVDIEDFDVVAYEYGIMRGALNEELATAFLIGDGREEDDNQKIHDIHIRPIWTDDELYTIHVDVDVDKMKNELQGTNTGANFGDEYVFAEAVITTALYAREQYKGSHPDFFASTHTVNRMMTARDMNGRRIYNTKAELTSALNVGKIIEVDKFDGLTRTASDMSTKKLLGIFVNMDDYQVGCAKKGEIATFDDFDIDFNQQKFMMETRLSAALTRVKSAIALEEPVV